MTTGPTHGLHWSYFVFPYPPAGFLIKQRTSVLSWTSVFLPKVYVDMPRSPSDGIGKPGFCAVSVTHECEMSSELVPSGLVPIGLVPSGRDSWELAFSVSALSRVRIKQEDHHLKTGNRALVRHGVYLDLAPATLQNFVKGMFVVSTTHSMVISYSILWKLTYDTSQVAMPRKILVPISLILYSAGLEVSVPKSGVLPPGGMTGFHWKQNKTGHPFGAQASESTGQTRNRLCWLGD